MSQPVHIGHKCLLIMQQWSVCYLRTSHLYGKSGYISYFEPIWLGKPILNTNLQYLTDNVGIFVKYLISIIKWNNHAGCHQINPNGYKYSVKTESRCGCMQLCYLLSKYFLNRPITIVCRDGIVSTKRRSFSKICVWNNQDNYFFINVACRSDANMIW